MTHPYLMALAGSLLLAMPGAVRAQHETDSAHKTHGLWRLSIRHPQLGVVHGFIQEIDASWLNGMEVYHPQGAREPYLYRFFSRGDSIFGAIPSLDSTDHGSWFRARRSPDGNRIVGRWKDREDREFPIMMERLRPEMRVNAIQGIENGALDYPRMVDAWKYATANGNLPYIRIDIAGQNLVRNNNPSQWARVSGMHTAIDDSLMVLHMYEGTRLGDSLRVYAWLRKGAKPGLKRLTIEGGTVEFPLEFENYEEKLDVKALRLVRKADNGYQEVGDSLVHGETFYLEAQLHRRPESDHVMARLTWLNDGRSVRLDAADETGLLFRSAALLTETPASGEKPGTGGVRPEDLLLVKDPPLDP